MAKYTEMKKKDLLALPVRPWRDAPTIYDTILVVATGRKHDSGWALMAIIGCDDKGEAVEIAGYCDDIDWHIADAVRSPMGASPSEAYSIPNLRTDATFPSGVMHFWHNEYQFKVGPSLSSMDVELVRKR